MLSISVSANWSATMSNHRECDLEPEGAGGRISLQLVFCNDRATRQAIPFIVVDRQVRYAGIDQKADSTQAKELNSLEWRRKSRGSESLLRICSPNLSSAAGAIGGHNIALPLEPSFPTSSERITGPGSESQQVLRCYNVVP